MLANKYNSSSMLQSDYGPLEQVGSLDSPVFRGRGHDGSLVALRFWRGEDEQVRRTLLDMAYAASLIRHPMLCAVGGCQSFGGSLLCIVSEFVHGVRLDRWMSEAGVPGMRIALDFARRLSLGVHAIHQRGLTHLALHPGNLIVLHPDTQPGGRIVAKLLDVGVPALLHDWPPSPETASYLAPELLEGVLDPNSPGASIHPRMNVYSLGCLLHYLCTGQAPFTGETLPELVKNASGGLRVSPRELNPAISEELEQLIVRTLSVDPVARPASASELATLIGAIEAQCKDSGIRQRVDTPPPSEAPRDSVPPARASFPELAALTSSGLRPSGAPDGVHPRAEALLRSGSYARVSIPNKPRRTLWLGAAAACVALLSLWLIADSSRQAKRELAQRPPTRSQLGPARSVESTWHGTGSPHGSSPAAPLASIPPTRTTDEVRATEPANRAVLAVNEPPAQRAADRPAEPSKSAAPAEAVPAQPSKLNEPVQRTAAAEPAAKPRPAVERAPEPKPAPVRAAPQINVIVPPPAPPPVAPAAPRVITLESGARGEAPQPAAPGPRKPADVQIAAINVRGSLTVSVVRRAIERVRPMLNQCYEPHLASGRAVGPLQVSAEIDEIGRLRNPSVSGGVPELNACVLKATGKIVAEAPDTGTVRASWILKI